MKIQRKINQSINGSITNRALTDWPSLTTSHLGNKWNIMSLAFRHLSLLHTSVTTFPQGLSTMYKPSKYTLPICFADIYYRKQTSRKQSYTRSYSNKAGLFINKDLKGRTTIIVWSCKEEFEQHFLSYISVKGCRHNRIIWGQERGTGKRRLGRRQVDSQTARQARRYKNSQIDRQTN